MCDSNQVMICLQLHNVSSFYSSYFDPQIKYEYHICCEQKDVVNASKSTENCLENVNHYLAIYLLFVSSLSNFHIHTLLQPGLSAAAVYDSKKYIKKTLAWLKRQNKSIQITIYLVDRSATCFDQTWSS
jgi:hypothetical protein